MSAGCCNHKTEFDGASKGFRNALWIVIFINAIMFIIEMVAGSIAGSQSLKADALDFFGDSVTYGISLYVIGMSLRVRSTAALLKGISLALMGFWVFGSTLYHVFILGVPQAPIMGAIGFLALAANMASVLILVRYKDGDANVRSVWLCSRNDAIGNIAVLIAATFVVVTNSAWPDLIVAGVMAGLFLWSATQIVIQSLNEMRNDSSCEVEADTCQK